MLRKASAVLAITMVLFSAACTSVTGPATDSGRATENSTDKVCSNDVERVIDIVSPGVGQVLSNGRTYHVVLQTENFCAKYSVEIQVSEDGGNTFRMLAKGDNLSSASWTITDARDLRPVIRVRAQDGLASGETAEAYDFSYQVRSPRRGGGRTIELP
jgi:hypothetical protein